MWNFHVGIVVRGSVLYIKRTVKECVAKGKQHALVFICCSAVFMTGKIDEKSSNYLQDSAFNGIIQ